MSSPRSIPRRTFIAGVATTAAATGLATGGARAAASPREPAGSPAAPSAGTDAVPIVSASSAAISAPRALPVSAGHGLILTSPALQRNLDPGLRLVVARPAMRPVTRPVAPQ